MEIKVTKIDEAAEQTLFVYDNNFGKVDNLVNCVMQDHFNNSNWWSEWYQKKAAEIKQQVVKTKHFYLWCSQTKNIGYCTRL